MIDEWHQSSLPSRTGTFRDVILDSCAGLVAQIVLFAILRTQRFRIEKSVLPKIGVM
jgi:VanZ family protein